MGEVLAEEECWAPSSILPLLAQAGRMECLAAAAKRLQSVLGRAGEEPMLRWRGVAAVVLIGALAGGCFGPELKTKLVCKAGVSAEVPFSMFNAHGGKHSSSELMPTDAAGVCDKMREAAIQMGLKVEQI